MVKKFLSTIPISLAFIISAPYAHAISIIMEEGTNGDRIRITQADESNNIQSLRVAPDALFIQVDNNDTNTPIQSPANVKGDFVNNIVPSDTGVSIGIVNSNFGFIQSKDTNGDVLIDIYPDALGSRWRETPKAKKAYDQLESIQALPSQNVPVASNTPIVQVETIASNAPITSIKPKAPAVMDAQIWNKSLISIANAADPADPADPADTTGTQNAGTQNIGTPPPLNPNIQQTQTPPPVTLAPAAPNADPNTAAQAPVIEVEKTVIEVEKPIEPTSFDYSLTNENSKEAKSLNPRKILEQKRKDEAEKKRQAELAKAEGRDVPTTPEAPSDTETPTEPDKGEPKKVAPVGEIIYVDEAGVPVPAPLDIPKTIKDMRLAKENSNYAGVLEAVALLKDKPLPSEIIEEILYNRMFSLFVINRNTLTEKGVGIIDAANEALNINLNAKRVPEALNVLALTSLALGRTNEANVHVDTLYRRYPSRKETPTSMLILANHYFQTENFIQASKYLQILIDEYPTGAFAKEAALLQTKSLHQQGDYKKTMAFIDFMDRRWNRLYLSDPEYFTIRAEIEEDSQNYNAAAATYWLMYNLDPKGEQADFALNKIADLYYKMNQKDKAREVLEELITSFPESQYRVSALLKVGENGVYEGNLPLEAIFDLLNEPNPNLPNLYYEQIITEYPDSQEARYAKLRLAAQALWEKDYLKAADQAQDFHLKNLDLIESDRALEILLRSIAPVMSLSISEKNYEQTLSLLEKYPPIKEHYLPYEAPLRMALGRALLNRRQEKEGEEMLAPFMEKLPTTQEEFDNGLYAYSITLANALNKQDWKKVLDTSAKVEGWNLPKEVGLQRLYSTALAAENLGLPARSLPIWKALAPNKDVPLYQRAYAQYFLARDAERRQNLREAYQANLDTLAMFEDLRTQQSPYADNERRRESMAALMDITEIAGRYTEALEWISKYRVFVPTDSPDYAGLQLREARLHKKMGDNLRWRSILEQIRDKEPDSVFGKMADSELTAFELARDLNRFAGQK